MLTTGNKSEMATGYCTLYGDMAGGFAVDQGRAEDARLRALRGPQRAAPARTLIPEAILEKPPSAELRPDQKDADSLPAVRRCSTRSSRATSRTTARPRRSSRRASTPSIGATGSSRLVDRNEYKRRQAPPGVRVSPKAFGKDRRLPITNRWPG